MTSHCILYILHSIPRWPISVYFTWYIQVTNQCIFYTVLTGDQSVYIVYFTWHIQVTSQCIIYLGNPHFIICLYILSISIRYHSACPIDRKGVQLSKLTFCESQRTFAGIYKLSVFLCLTECEIFAQLLTNTFNLCLWLKCSIHCGQLGMCAKMAAECQSHKTRTHRKKLDKVENILQTR